MLVSTHLPDPALECQDWLLQRVSRTFALTIPSLPAPLAIAVGNAYLLCRLADTVEDEPTIDWQRKQTLLQQLIEAVAGDLPAQCFAAGCLAVLPATATATATAARQLVAHTESVIHITHALNQTQRAAILRCLRIMTTGMLEFQHPAPTHGLPDLAQLDRYCYCVAGVVGEMLTEIFCDYTNQLRPRQEELLPLAVSFGQALQMTNIIKDIWEDQQRGTCWLPQDVFQSAGYNLCDLGPDNLNQQYQTGFYKLLSIVRQHLHNALTYTLILPRSETGMRRFCIWALAMAVLTLRNIHAHPQFTHSRQIKISRTSVKLVIAGSNLIIRSDRALQLLFNRLVHKLPAAASPLLAAPP